MSSGVNVHLPIIGADGEPCRTNETLSVVNYASSCVGVDNNYEIVGHRYPVINVSLAPNETFAAESGAMMHMSAHCKMQAYFGGLLGAANSVFSGEDIARVRFTNQSSEPSYIGITPNQPMAMIIPIDLATVDGMINAKRGAYFAGPESIQPKAQILPAQSVLACCCGGLPPIIQSVEGSGIAFLAAGGTVVKKSLDVGERILVTLRRHSVHLVIVDSDSVVAFSKSVGYDVKRVGSCITCCCAGEGCFNTELVGPGDVYIQSMPYEKLIKFLARGSSNATNDDHKKDKKSSRHHGE